MTLSRDIELMKTLRHLQPVGVRLTVQEVVSISDQPSLGRRWCPELTHNGDIGMAVVDGLSEPDERVISSFSEFVQHEDESGAWFTFLCADGLVIALARCEADSVDAETLRRLRNQLVSDVTTRVAAASPVARPFFAVLTGDGTIRSSSPEAPFNWAEPRVLSSLSQYCEEVTAHDRTTVLVPGYLVELRRLIGGGSTDILAAFRPIGFAKLPQLAILSPTQGRVVRFAAAGATAPEIARAMDRSAGTVRSHLREAYRRLDVASRMELLASSDELTSWGAR